MSFVGLRGAGTGEPAAGAGQEPPGGAGQWLVRQEIGVGREGGDGWGLVNAGEGALSGAKELSGWGQEVKAVVGQGWSDRRRAWLM